MAEELLRDLFITRSSFGQGSTNRDSVDLFNYKNDLKLVDGSENLSQAILNRLFTRKGELENIGHPEYGSRLFKLIGEPNNRRTKALCELYVRECLEEENRIKEIVDISIEDLDIQSANRNNLHINISVVAVGCEEPLILSMSMNLGG